MSDGRLAVFAGRVKTFPFTWRQGTSSSSPPVDCTGATCTVFSSSFPRNAVPTITPVDLTLGQFELTFPAELTKGLRAGDIYKVRIALTFTADPEHSPDPVTVETLIQ